MASGNVTIITADFRKKFELYKIPEYHTYYCDFERLIYYIDQFKLSIYPSNNYLLENQKLKGLFYLTSENSVKHLKTIQDKMSIIEH